VPQLTPGQPAPDFTLTDQNGAELSLADLRGSKAIVFCYPAASTPGCTREAGDFRDGRAALCAAGFEVLGLSPDLPEALARFAEQESLDYPLLSDPDRRVLTAWGAYGENKLYGKTVTGVIRSTFVLDERGVVVLARYNVRATGHVASLRKALQV
jgi:thioredoxin-dependent peroxiredoxin